MVRISRSPRNGDRVLDAMDPQKHRWGTVKGSSEVQGTLFIKVLFDDQRPFDEPDELEYESHFTQENCGNGRWDTVRQCWLIEPDEDTLPQDHPMVVSFNKQIEQMNLRLLKDRLGTDWNLNLIQLEKLALINEHEARELGPRNPYFSYYEIRGQDYRRAIASKLQVETRSNGGA